jgi:hypothetical protein
MGFLITLILLNLAYSNESSAKKYWIVFKDKGIYENISLNKGTWIYDKIISGLSERAIRRRLKVVGDKNKLIDYYDLPVYDGYIDELISLGVKPIVISRWLNAVSAYLDDTALTLVSKLPFVAEVTPVARSAKVLSNFTTSISPSYLIQKFNYGPSEPQLRFTGVKELHSMNIIGKGVLIGMMDTGFRRTHESLREINVVAEYDFIFGDSSTSNSPEDDPRQDLHGTITLSVIGGKKDGKIYGVAFGADFILAKTEDIRSETPTEEDNWVAAVEWMEALGVDVVSSSVGYLDWYTPQDMDGNTAKITRAADIAVQKGVVVVNAAGNERMTPWKIIIAPADGKYVIAVGAVDSLRRIARFSSMGPTADGRIKPDVCALGVSVFSASTSLKNSGYGYFSGTSLSCPLVAGIAALLLSVKPELTPLQVRDAIRNTASRANNPDNDYGWGIVNGLEALLYFGPIISNFPEIEESDNGIKISIYAMSKSGIKEVFIQSDGLKIPMNQVDANLFSATVDYLPVNFSIYAVDNSGDTAVFRNIVSSPPEKYFLSQNFPNPFNSGTTFILELPEPAHVEATIFNILGQKVKTLVDRFYPFPGEFRIFWDGRDDNGFMLPSGVYFCRLRTKKYTTVRKIVLMR